MEEYRSTLNQVQLVVASTACLAGQMNLLGEYKILPGELIAMGYGSDSTQSNAIGRIYMTINTVSAESPGVVRIVAMSATDRQYEIVYESRTEVVDQNPTDRTKQLPFELFNLFISENKRWALFFQPDANATITQANSVVRIDITRVAL
jgi:hypothetical protein